MIPLYGTKYLIKTPSEKKDLHEFVLREEALDQSYDGLTLYLDIWGHKMNPENPSTPQRKAGEYYIEIKRYKVHQQNFIEMSMYRFYIIKHSSKNQRTLTNLLAYTDARDCYDAARWLIFKYKSSFDEYFDLEENPSTYYFEIRPPKELIVKEYTRYYIDPNLEIDQIPLDKLNENLKEDIYFVEEPESKPPHDYHSPFECNHFKSK
jgi:hypothetical protein